MSITGEAQGVAKALTHVFVSPNMPDANLEPVNLVDTTDYTANGIAAVAGATDRNGDVTRESAERIRDGLYALADDAPSELEGTA